jgi:hypothetical protein
VSFRYADLDGRRVLVQSTSSGRVALCEAWSEFDQERHRQNSLLLAPDAAVGNLPWRKHQFGKGLFVPRTGDVYTWRAGEDEDGAPWHQHVLAELKQNGKVLPREPVHAVEIDPNGWVAYSSLMTDAGKDDPSNPDASDEVKAQRFMERSPEMRGVLQHFADKFGAMNAYPPLKTQESWAEWDAEHHYGGKFYGMKAGPMPKKTKAGAPAWGAGLDSPGRGPTGGLRNFKAMSDAKLSDTVDALNVHGEDKVAQLAAITELHARQAIKHVGRSDAVDSSGQIKFT